LPITFVALMGAYDWRILWIAAAMISILGIPLLYSLLRQERTPQSFMKTESTLGMEGRHWTRNQAFKQFLFWFMIPAMLGPSAFNTAFFFHQVHFAEVKGISHVGLVALFPVYTVLTIGFMMLAGWLIDKYGPVRLFPFVQIPIAVGFLVFAFADGVPGLLVGLFFLAVTSGGMSTIPNAFWAEVYGTGHIGSVKALVAAVIVLGSAIGPGITGLGIDLGLGIETQYILVAGYFLFATGMMMIGVARARVLLPQTT